MSSSPVSTYPRLYCQYCPYFRNFMQNRGDKNQFHDFTGRFPPSVLKFSVLTPYQLPGIHSRLMGPCHSLYHLSELFCASIILPFQKNSDQIMLLYTVIFCILYTVIFCRVGIILIPNSFVTGHHLYSFSLLSFPGYPRL